jgi:hypothetical protein
MSAMLRTEEVEQDPDTGELVRSYALTNPFWCYASAIVASGKDAPGVFEKYGSMGFYSSSDMLRMYTAGSIPKSAQVTWIVDSTGHLFAEDDGNPTIYDSNGSSPVVDAYGRIVEYVSFLTRSEVQDVEGL